VFSDAPSQVAQEVHPCLVDRAHGLDCDRHKQVGLAEYGIFCSSSCLLPSLLLRQVSGTSRGRTSTLACRLPLRPHVTQFPVLHGNCMTPSGRLPSVLSRPDSSFTITQVVKMVEARSNCSRSEVES